MRLFCFQGGGEVQEQRVGDEQPEAPPLPHSVREVQGEDRVRHQRRSESLENCSSKSRHCYFEVNMIKMIYKLGNMTTVNKSLLGVFQSVE